MAFKAQQTSESTAGKFGTTLFGLVFLGMGLVFVCLILSQTITNVKTRFWVKTPCTITASSVDTISDGYAVSVEYTYKVNGRTYNSRQFQPGNSRITEDKIHTADALAQKYHKGSRTICYVNPANPADAVLNRQLGAEAFLALIPLLFMVIGAAGAFHSLRRNKKARSFTNLAGKTIDTDTGQQSPFEPTVLKPKTSRAGKIFGSIAISIFWNGIISVFVYQAWQGWHAGHPDYFLTVFMIPFVVIGLIMIGSIFYFSLAAFNPQPVIILLKDTIRLGDLVPIRWALSGNVYKIQNFKLALTGEESATYRRGTKTHTDQQVFYEKNIVNDHNPESMRRGESTVQIPAESMHSFKSDNNSIVWKITMHCDVPRWPDSKNDFEINVFPMLIEDF